MGVPVADLVRQFGIIEQIFYRWKRQCAGLESDQVRELKQVVEENARLKRLVAEALRFLPRNAAKRFPKLTPRQASDQSRSNGGSDTISAANVNVHLGNLSSFLNWAVNEELLSRNPLRGLRLHDETAKKDKRLPISADQLRKIFNATLYRCH